MAVLSSGMCSFSSLSTVSYFYTSGRILLKNHPEVGWAKDEPSNICSLCDDFNVFQKFVFTVVPAWAPERNPIITDFSPVTLFLHIMHYSHSFASAYGCLMHYQKSKSRPTESRLIEYMMHENGIAITSHWTAYVYSA